MDGVAFHALILLPIGLGLLGFIEPCSIGGHMIFLSTQENRTRLQQSKALATFIAARTIIAGGCGALIAVLGQQVIDVQTAFWIVFGLVYGCLGLAILSGKARHLNVSVNMAPKAWRHAANPLVLGLAFGLNIPACAAPILFGLLGMAATGGTAAAGFLMMAVFGLALSMPLALFVYVPRATTGLETVRRILGQRPWILGAIFLVLGVWSIWFGLYVDPADWSGR